MTVILRQVWRSHNYRCGGDSSSFVWGAKFIDAFANLQLQREGISQSHGISAELMLLLVGWLLGCHAFSGKNALVLL